MALTTLCKSPTGPVLFRSLEKWSPTFVIDEADTVLKNNDDLREVINSGWTVGTRVLRCDPITKEPCLYSKFYTKHHYESDLKTLRSEVGSARLADLCFRDFKRWHETFRGPEERIARAHALMAKIRIVMAFGALLRLPHCRELSQELSGMTFPMPKKRREFLTAEQVVALRKVAHVRGFHSIALAQAIQFESMLRQKDVIGEWLPIAEPGVSDINDGRVKWLHGLHWRMIDSQLHFKKVLSKSLRGRRAAAVAGAGNEEEFNLRSYPMFMEELAGKTGSGPLIVCEYTRLPWRTKPFQAKWRELARLAGIS